MHDFVNERGFSNLTMELILMVSKASVKMTEAIGALSELEKAKKDFLWRKENPPDQKLNTSPNPQTEDRHQ